MALRPVAPVARRVTHARQHSTPPTAIARSPEPSEGRRGNLKAGQSTHVAIATALRASQRQFCRALLSSSIIPKSLPFFKHTRVGAAKRNPPPHPLAADAASYPRRTGPGTINGQDRASTPAGRRVAGHPRHDRWPHRVGAPPPTIPLSPSPCPIKGEGIVIWPLLSI